MSEEYNSEETAVRSDPEPRYSPEIKSEKKGMSAKGVVALALCCSLLGGVVGATGSRMFMKDRSEETPPAIEETIPDQPEEPEKDSVEASVTQEPVQSLPAEGGMLTAAQVYAQNVDSTVGITTSITTNYWGYQTTSAASGSGFILTQDGYILTNYHVIEDSSSVTVTTFDNNSYPAEIIGYDISNDIAVLKIDASDLKPVTLGDSDSLQVGDTVLAIGNPLGELTFSLTQGIVSALHREVTLSSGSTMNLIQTDTAINSGNSGGALFNLRGEVVGITNAKYSSSGSSSSASIDNIGFAIPIDHVRGIVESIIVNGYIVKPYIGVSVATVSSEMQSYNFPQGAAIKEINDDSPAAAAGLHINDIITAVNGQAITSSSDLVNVITESTPGDVLHLSVYRQNQGDIQIDLTVGEQKRPAKEEPKSTQQESNQGSPFGYGFPFSFGGQW